MRIGYNFIGKFPLILGIFLALIGKKRYFLALGTIPVNGVGFMGRKITDKVFSINASLPYSLLMNTDIDYYHFFVSPSVMQS